MTATWSANATVAAGDIRNPVTANGHSYRCVVGGTTGGTEPAWVGRYQTITDGSTVTWAVYTVITPATVRTQLNLEGTTGQYSDDTIGGYILSAISSLETACSRYLVNRPGAVVTLTSMLRTALAIPGLRTPIAVQYAGATVVQNQSYWLLSDAMTTGVYTGIQFRAYRTDMFGSGIPGTPYGPWIANSQWFDQAADSPFYPGNYGGGVAYTSMPNDTSITGDWGYEPGFEPGNFVHALEVFSEWYTQRPPALLADTVLTPAGGIVSYSQMPAEVQDFVKEFSAGQMAVSVG